MAHNKSHIKSNKQQQKQSQKINQWLQSADYQTLINTLCPRHDQEGQLDKVLPSLTNDQKYALGLAFYKLHQPRKALSLWAGLIKKRGEEFDTQVKNLATTLLGQWDTDTHRVGASAQSPWSPAEIRGLYAATKNLIPTHPRFLAIRDHFINILWNQGQSLIDPASPKPVENPPLDELTKILGQAGSGNLDNLISLTQCQFWTRRSGTLEAKFNLLNQYLTVAASLVHRQKPADFCKSIHPFIEAFFQWYGPTLGSHVESLRTLTQIQVKTLSHVSGLLHSADSNHLLEHGVLWSPGFYVRQNPVPAQDGSRSFLSILPQKLAFFYTEAGFSLIAFQAKCDSSLIKIDRDQFVSETYLRRLWKAGQTFGFLSGLVLLAQKPGSPALDLLTDLEKEGPLEWDQNELELFLRESLDAHSIWSQSSELIIVWLYLIKSCPNISNDPAIDQIIAQKVHGFVQKHVENKDLCMHCLDQLSIHLPKGPTKDLLAATILKLKESESLVNEIERNGYKIKTPGLITRNRKKQKNAYFIKLIDAYLNTSPILGVWNQSKRFLFIRILELYFDTLKLDDDLSEEFNMLFIEHEGRSSESAEDFRIDLEQIAPLLGCSMDLAKLLAVGKGPLSTEKTTKQEEVISTQNGYFLSNPYRILGFDSQPTKQQVMTKVLHQMKLNPQNLVSIRLAQSALFDALNAPVFALLYCFRRSPSILDARAMDDTRAPLVRSLDPTETAGGVV